MLAYKSDRTSNENNGNRICDYVNALSVEAIDRCVRSSSLGKA